MIASGRHTANRYGWTALIASLAIATVSYGETPPTWKMGASLDAQLQQAISIHFAERPLRGALQRLEQEFGTAVFLDRRLNPDQPVTLAAADLPLSQIIAELVQQAAANQQMTATTCRLGGVTYWGPKEAGKQLAVAAAARRDEATRLPAKLRTQVLKTSPLSWPELAEPRTLVQDLAAKAGLTLVSGQVIPHDLWPAVDLPPLTVADQLSLVLAGFDLTYRIDVAKQQLELVSWPANSAQSTESNQTATTRAQAKGGAPKSSISTGRSVYSLRVSGQAAGNVLKTIAQSLQKELTYEPAVVEKLRTPVTFDLKNVPLEQLLETALAPCGLSYEITEKQLRVRAAN